MSLITPSLCSEEFVSSGEDILDSGLNKRLMNENFVIFMETLYLHALSSMKCLWPPGLMDKALPSGGKDSEFESWGGRFCPQNLFEHDQSVKSHRSVGQDADYIIN